MATRICPKDKGHYVFGGSNFCPECGTSVMVRSCPKCSQILTDKQKFCEKCGENLVDVKPTEIGA